MTDVARNFPPLYAIVDRETLNRASISVSSFAEELRVGGVLMLQYRDKVSGPQEILRSARQIADVFRGMDATFLLNDRADLAALLGWGVHVGQGDLPVAAARQLVGDKIVGVSTHNEAQLKAAEQSTADYIAIGPVFATYTKLDAESVVGLDGVRLARELTMRPLVAIGGISLENAFSVVEAGADSVAVISALLPQGDRSTLQRTQDFRAALQG